MKNLVVLVLVTALAVLVLAGCSSVPSSNEALLATGKGQVAFAKSPCSYSDGKLQKATEGQETNYACVFWVNPTDEKVVTVDVYDTRPQAVIRLNAENEKQEVIWENPRK